MLKSCQRCFNWHCQILFGNFSTLLKEGLATSIWGCGTFSYSKNYLMSTTMQSLGLFDQHPRSWANTGQDFLSIRRFLVIQKRIWNPAKFQMEFFSKTLHETTFSTANYFLKNLPHACLSEWFWIRFSCKQTAFKKTLIWNLSPTLHKSWSFPLKISTVMWPKQLETSFFVQH